MSYKQQEVLTLCEHMGSPPVFGEGCIAHLFSFLCCVICFACLRPVSCVTNVASVSGLSIADFPFYSLMYMHSVYDIFLILNHEEN